MNINVIKTDVGLYVFATRVCLKQTMLLLQEPHQEFYTSTWEIGGVGTVGLNNPSAMLGSICQQVDRFCQDYLAENRELAAAVARLQLAKLKSQLPSCFPHTRGSGSWPIIFLRFN